MKLRSQIPDKYKWELESILLSDEDWERLFSSVKPYVDKFVSFKGKLKNINKLYEYILLETEFDEKVSKLSLYPQLHRSVDMTNPKYIEMEARLSNFGTELGEKTSFASVEISNLKDSTINKILKDPRFATRKQFFSDIKRNRVHVLSENEEKLIQTLSDGMGEQEEVFDNLMDMDLKFEPIEVNGKKLELNQINYSNYIDDKDRNIRKQAFENHYKAVGGINNTLSANFISACKSENAFRKIRKFDTLKQASFFSDKIADKVYDTLIQSYNSMLSDYHKYWSLNKKMSGLSDFCMYDVYVSPIKAQDKKYKYDDCVALANLALAPLGHEYLSIVNHAVESGWIDVYPCKGKLTGGFQTAIYGVHPYIFLNYTDKLEDVNTFVHEMGHAMHSYYSDKYQPRELSQYTIFLAEIASTVNEIFFIEYMIDHAKTNKERMYFVDKYMAKFSSSFFRQTMFSKFEDYVFTSLENNEPLSAEKLNQKFKDLTQEQYGKSVNINDEIKYGWSRIPHFYSPYYVFKYATGFVSALSIVHNIKNTSDGLDKYMIMLKSGGKDYSLETLKKAGVNLESDEPYKIAHNKMNELIGMLKSFDKK